MSKRANGEGTIYKSGKVWIAEISYTEKGNRKRKKRRARSQADAKAALDEMKNTIGAVCLVDRSKKMLHLFERWRSHVIHQVSDNTISGYNSTLDVHLIPRLGMFKIKDLTTSHIDAMYDSMRNDKVGGSAMQKTHKVLKLVLDKAVAWRLIVSNPILQTAKPKHSQKEIDFFEQEECERLLAETEGSIVHAFISLGIGTGLRQGEMFALTWKDIDFENKLADINKAVVEVRGKVSVKRPKTTCSIRKVPLPQFVIDDLHEHRKILLKQGLLENDLVFPSKRGTIIIRTNFAAYYWNRALKTCNLKQRGAHSLRHTFATLSLSKGVPLPAVSKILGHANPSFTLKIYAHAMKSDYFESARVLSKLFA